MRLAHLPFIAAVLAVASTAAAHSWELGSVVGTIDPTTVRCDDHGCTATLRAERIRLERGDFDRRDDAVKLTVPARGAGRQRGDVGGSAIGAAGAREIAGAGARRIRLAG